MSDIIPFSSRRKTDKITLLRRITDRIYIVWFGLIKHLGQSIYQGIIGKDQHGQRGEKCRFKVDGTPIRWVCPEGELTTDVVLAPHRCDVCYMLCTDVVALVSDKS